MLKWQLLHQRILWPIFMAYCGLADINQRLFICLRRRLRSIGYKTLYWCAFGIKLTDAKAMTTLINSSLYIMGSDSQLSVTDFDDILVWSVLKLTLHEPNYKKKEIYWPIRLTNSGLGSAFFVLSSFVRFVWVCIKYIHMRYWPSVRILAEFFFCFFFFTFLGTETKSRSKKE